MHFFIKKELYKCKTIKIIIEFVSTNLAIHISILSHTCL